MQQNFNTLHESLHSALGGVAKSADLLATSIGEISSSSEQMAAGSSEQASQATEVFNFVSEMTQNIIINTENANEMANTTKEQGIKAREGGKVVAKVKAHGRHKKIEIIKFNRRKHYDKRTGHRQNYTELEITDIQAG